MNAHRHRLVFNRARGLVMAVAEIACACGKSPATTAGPAMATPPGFSLAKLRPAAFAVLLAAGAQLAVVPLADAQVVAYKAAPANQRPTVLTAGNGVPLVNIQTPKRRRRLAQHLQSVRRPDAGRHSQQLANQRADSARRLGAGQPVAGARQRARDPQRSRLRQSQPAARLCRSRRQRGAGGDRQPGRRHLQRLRLHQRQPRDADHRHPPSSAAAIWTATASTAARSASRAPAWTLPASATPT